MLILPRIVILKQQEVTATFVHTDVFKISELQSIKIICANPPYLNYYVYIGLILQSVVESYLAYRTRCIMAGGLKLEDI